MKALLTSVKTKIIGTVAGLLLQLISRTIKWDQVFLSNYEETVFETHPRIICFWHGRQLMIPWAYQAAKSEKRLGLFALISMHSDGRIIANAIKLFGASSVEGSSTRGGREASKKLLSLLKVGSSIVITPDGPKGPIYKAKPGALKLAYRSKAPIVPISYSAEKYWTFGSWDKMILPKPFTKGVFVFGKPYYIEEDITDQNLAQKLAELEQALNLVQKAADSFSYD